MLWKSLTSLRDLGRLHDIASTLIYYGFGDMVRRVGLAKVLEHAGKALNFKDVDAFIHLSPPARVRHVLEELGPTFVKLGQLLSTRVDLFDEEWISEFSKLQDNVPAVPYTEIRTQLIEDLGAPPEDVFEQFDSQPLAAASIAQVYRARLPEGDEVIVKVRRPGIRPIVEADLRWMMRIAQLIEAESLELRAFKPQEIVRRFGQSIRNEMDFSVECRNAAHIAKNFADYNDDDWEGTAKPEMTTPRLAPIVIPKIYWAWSGERVCVQEIVIGIPGSNLAALQGSGLNRKILARRGARAMLKMILQDGFFHADPHPGNLFYLPENRLAFIDFGMVGRLNEQRRDQILQLMLGLVKQAPAQVAEILMDWAGDIPINEEILVGDIESFTEQYYGVPLQQLKFGLMVSDFVRMIRQHRIQLPPDLTLLIKAFISMEGMGRDLDPDFDMARESLPILEKTFRERFSLAAVAKRSWHNVQHATLMLADLPADISRLLRVARRGRLEIHIDVTHLKRFGNQLDMAMNRLVVGIVIAALIVGASIVMTVQGGPSLLGLPLFGLIGFLGSVLGSLWLLFSVWRTNRKDGD